MNNNSDNKSVTILTRLEKLRALMAEKEYDAVIVPTGDYHMSEYTGDYFKCREFITGFTGSAGTAVIFRESVSNSPASGLWTDSRYFVQAEQQLAGTGIRLFKTGLPGTPKIIDHLCAVLPEGSRVACDGRVISFDTFAEWYDALEDAGIELDEQADLVGELWDSLSTSEEMTSENNADSSNSKKDLSRRPPLPRSKAFEYDIKYCGKSRAEKLAELCRKIEDRGADAHILTSLDDIAWLLNIRGSDVHCNPVVLSYFLVENCSNDSDNLTADCDNSRFVQMQAKWRFRLFANIDSFDDDLKSELASDGVGLTPYEDISDALADLECSSILLSATDTNSYLYGLIPPAVYIAESENPTQIMKAVKNPVEIENARAAHLKDGIALTKFMYWLKTSVASDCASEITEISAAEKLFELRSAQENFMGNSFDPIIAYGGHAAIVHYSATEETNIRLQPKGLVLCDTGGHYLEGTTDVTRTIALGTLTEEELKMSTAVLKGHIALAGAVFPRGLNGGNLDYLAHSPLWRLGKDYGHGTGHGVGHFLNVHEGPNYIHWTRNGNTGTTPPFEPGMITSCEPGYYCEGSDADGDHGFGIRHESLILCKPYSDTTQKNLLCFEELTMVPFDPDAVDLSALDERERNFLADYHATIFERISPHLTESEKKWLQSICESFSI